MAEFTDVPVAVDGIGTSARFRTMTTPSRKAEFEMEVKHPAVTMCSVQLTVKKDAPATPALADYKDRLIAVAKVVVARIA